MKQNLDPRRPDREIIMLAIRAACPPDLRADTLAEKRALRARIALETRFYTEILGGRITRLPSPSAAAPGPLVAGAAEVRGLLSGSREVEVGIGGALGKETQA